MTMTSCFSALVVVLLIITTGSVRSQESTVEMQITDTHALPGSSVTFTCRVSNQGQNTMTIIKQFKEGGPDGKGWPQLISTGSSLRPSVKRTGRYELNKIPITDSVQLYKLFISNVTAEDSGPYECAILDTDVRDVKEFLVYHPVQDLMFKVGNETLGSSMVLNETSRVDLSCTAAGSIPAATVTVMVGDKDITKDFHKRTASNLHCYSGSETCLAYETFSIEAYTMDYQPTWEAHGKDLKCRATVGDGQIFEAKEVVHKIEMHFAPKFDGAKCKPYVLGRLHVAEYRLSCVIHSNPGYPDFIWEFMWEGRTEKLANNQMTSDGEITAHQTDNGNGSLEVYLEFKKLNKRHFMTYTLNTNNSLGNNTKKIKLEEDPRYRISLPPDDTTNAAVTTASSAILVSLFALMRLSL